MATQVWLPPNPQTQFAYGSGGYGGGSYGSGQTLKSQAIYVLSSAAPTISPAPAGHPIVPAGYIRQLGTDGYRDTGGIYINGVPMPNIASAGLPYYTGVLFPVIGYDPAAGRPFHTPPNVNRKDGIND